MAVNNNKVYVEEDILLAASNNGCNSPCTLP